MYLIRAVPEHGAGWRESVEMALTGAAFGVVTTVWLARAPLAHLAQRADAEVLIGELTDFGVRCVAAAEDLPEKVPAGVEALDATALAGLGRDRPLVVL